MKNHFYVLCMLLLFCIITSCAESEETTINSKQIFIDIHANEIIQHANPGDEVPDYVSMYNGPSNFKARTNGVANLQSNFSPGDEVIWTLGDNQGIRLIQFEFFLLEGTDFFSLPGGSFPQELPDGTWKAIVSPNAEEGSLMKYNIYFEIAGQGTFWWDPLARVTNNE